MSTLVGTTGETVNRMTQAADDADAHAVAWGKKHAAYEQRLEASTAMVHDARRVEDLASEMAALDADNSAFKHWASVHDANGAAYESQVQSKLASVGAEVPRAPSRALPNFHTNEFEGLAEAANQELHASLAHYDAQILSVLKDERLSEAEKEAAVAALKREQAAEAARIHAEQLQTARAEAGVSAAVDRFDALSAQAEAAAQRAEADMTPQAQAVRQQLRNLTNTLTHLEGKPYLQSALEVSTSRAGLDPSYRSLAQANADLRAQIVKAEGVLAARSR